MPFTPIHIGPVMAVKAILQDRFSLMVFGWSKIVIDLQPLFAMLDEYIHLHGFSHTLMGASLLGLLAAISGKYCSEIGLRLLKLSPHLPIKWSSAFLSAFIGVYSHVILDSIMHDDLYPFAPFSILSAVYRLIGIGHLHLFFLTSGVLGSFVYFIYRYIKK
jgi:membrane-bound metal-dependent hydrolase YbcI (DUF457 family)